MALQHLRSGTAHKRPIPSAMSAGQIAINTNEASPGLFFRDSNGDLVKAGPVHVGATAPNSSPASTDATALVSGTVYQILTVGTTDFTLVGAADNNVGTIFTATGAATGDGTVSGQQGVEKGEQWLDTSGSAYVMKVYDGTDWRDQTTTYLSLGGGTLTGAVLLDNAASAAAPDLAFDGDTDTGLFSSGANEIGISIGGTQEVTIDSSGRVLVGTTSTIGVGNASAGIQSAGTTISRFSGAVFANSTNGAVLALGKSRSATVGSNTIVQVGDTLGQIRFAGDDGVDLNSVGASIIARVDGTPGENDMPGSLAFSTTADGDSQTTERMRVDSGGRLLIGGTSSVQTSSQDNRLQIQGTNQATGRISIQRSSNDTGGAGIHLAKARGSGFTIAQEDDQIGIIAFNASDGTDFNGQAANIQGLLDGTPGTDDLPGRLVFSTSSDGTKAPTERMRIDSQGRVGIGEDTPQKSLHISDSAAVQLRLESSTANSRLELKASGTTSNPTIGAQADDIQFRTGNAETARLNSSGQLFIGTVSAVTTNTNHLLQMAATGGGRIALARDDSAIAASELLGEITFWSGDGGYEQAARIKGESDKGHGAGDKPGRIVFMTSPDNSTTPAEAMRITSQQFVGIGTSSPQSRLDVTNPNADPSIYFQNTASTGSDRSVSINFGFSGGVGAAVRATRAANAALDTTNLRFHAGGTGDADEKMRIDADGRVLIGRTSSVTTNTNAKLQIRDDGGAHVYLFNGQVAGGNLLGGINFGAEEGSGFSSARISAHAHTDFNTNDHPTYIRFDTTPDNSGTRSERMRILHNGNVAIGSTNANQRLYVQANHASQYALRLNNEGNSTNRYGMQISCGQDNGAGTLINFTDGNGSNLGSVTFSGGTVTYGAFTAHHPCALTTGESESDYAYGTLLETVSISPTPYADGTDSERGILYEVRKTQSANSRAVLGAYGGSMADTPDAPSDGNLHQALVLGDGHILCNNSGGDIAIGDGICSSATAGIGQKATASPSMIIGIAQEAVTFANDTEQKLVAVQYGLQQFTPWND